MTRGEEDEESVEDEDGVEVERVDDDGIYEEDET